MDPLSKVIPGDPPNRNADTHNAMVDAVRGVRRLARTMAGGELPGHPRPQAYVLTDGSTTLTRFQACALGSIVTDPASYLAQFSRAPVFNCAALTEGQPFVVAVRPAAASSLAAVMIAGVVPAQVVINDAAHEFVAVDATPALGTAETGYARIVWKADTSGTQWCLLQLPAAAAAEAVADPETYDTLGADTEGSETASTDTWTAGGEDGLHEWYVSRMVYNHAGDKVLYAMLRKRVFDAAGRLYSVSAETRITVDAATDHASE